MKPIVKRTQSGFALVTAIFIIVVLAALGAYMVTIGTAQRQTSTLSLLGAQAHFAAESGLQWATRKVLTTGACFSSPTSFTLSGGGAAGYSVDARCTATPVTEGPDSYSVFTLRVTASRGSLDSSDFVRRSIRVTVTNAP